MPNRRLPVQPDIEQLRHQAKDLLRAIHRDDPPALEDLREFHPEPVDPATAKLADAQLTLARSYGAPSWARMVQSCDVIDAICRDDINALREMIVKHPYPLHEDAGIRGVNWGPPLSYAANVGRDRMIEMLHGLGAKDSEYGMGRAALQGRESTARLLHKLLGQPRVSDEMLDGPAYTLNVTGTKLAFEFGARVRNGDRQTAPVAAVLQSDSRNPSAKHAILEMYVEHGADLPDTPTMALHRGRLDLLEEHMRRDAGLLDRTFTFAEIFPPSLECIGEHFPRTSLDGVTLDLQAAFDSADWQVAQRAFMKRHLLAHKSGIIDEKYRSESGDTSAISGRRIDVTRDEVDRVAAIIERLGGALIGSLPTP